jgi:hypothetical protein
MKNTVQIILAQQSRTDGASDKKTRTFRIAKLVGAVAVSTMSRRDEYHVGDVITENVARDLSLGRAYVVTVTEQKE